MNFHFATHSKDINNSRQKVRALRAVYRRLFGQPKEEMVWSWLRDLVQDINRLEWGRVEKDPGEAYRVALIEELNEGLIDELSKSLTTLEQLLQSTPGGSSGANAEMIRGFINQMDLTAEGQRQISETFSKLSVTQLPAAVNQLKEVLANYQKFKVPFTLLSAALLYYLPADTYTTYASFIRAIGEKSIWENKFTEEQWLPIVRYLSQATFSGDMELVNWALRILSGPAFTPQMVTDERHAFLFKICINLVFSKYKNLFPNQQELLLKTHGWWAIAFGVPLEDMVETQLMLEPEILAYIARSGKLAETLLTSEATIAPGGQPMAVKDLLTGFLAAAGENDRAESAQQAYVVSIIRSHQWPESAAEATLRFIQFYIHLRECDLADFNGRLSEIGRKPRFDWKQFLTEDLTDQKLEDAREYLSLVRRPAMNKIRIVAALNSVPWTEEPFFTKALALSNVYEEVFGPKFGPLVYFDGQTGGWTTNLDFPPLDMHSVPLY